MPLDGWEKKRHIFCFQIRIVRDTKYFTMSKANSLNRFAAEMQQLMPAFLGAMIRRERNAISQGIITLPQFLGLSFLRANPGSPVKAFAATLGLQLSSASGLLDRLAKLGLLKRTHSKTDRRVVLLTLTAKGERMVDEIATQKKESVAGIFSSLSPEERTTYLELMKKVVGHLK
jgi:DNA-binding MarR family transcriptional regulator